MLQPKIAKMYVASIEGTAKEFVQRCIIQYLFYKRCVINIDFRIEKIKNCNEEVPPDFIDEIHKWSLECKIYLISQKFIKYHLFKKH